jgi:hypothetical protein
VFGNPKASSGVPGVFFGTVSCGFGNGTPHDFEVDAIGYKPFDPSQGSGIFKDNTALEMGCSFGASLGLVHNVLSLGGEGLADLGSICIGVVVEGEDPISRTRHSAKYLDCSKDMLKILTEPPALSTLFPQEETPFVGVRASAMPKFFTSLAAQRAKATALTRTAFAGLDIVLEAGFALVPILSLLNFFKIIINTAEP